MPQPNNPQVVARQVERIVRQLNSLSTLPAVAAGLLSRLSESGADPAALAETIQSDPALTAKVLALAHQEGVRFTDGPSVAEAAAKLSSALLREAVISVKVFDLFDRHEDADAKRPLPRKQMARHSLAVACCAAELAERLLPPEQRPTAYLAGLLHDIGKCALDEVMPKSFMRMVDEARTAKTSLVQIEQTHLGLDHAVLGKRLAQKWFLPEPVAAAVWLHHCDAQTLAADLPDAQMIRIVALADRMARAAGVGHGGSYDTPHDIEEFARLLSLDAGHLAQIADNLAEGVRQKSHALGLETPDDAAQYYALIRKTAEGLAQDNRKLAASSDECRVLTAQAKLISDFLQSIDEHASALDMAQAFAAAWQTHCQSGLTCVYAVPDSTEPLVELAAIDRQGRIDLKSLQMPEGVPPVPHDIRTQPSIQPAADGAKWLLEQLGADFDPARMKMVPLTMGDEAVAVLVYEDFAPAKDGYADSSILLCCRVAAATIAMAQAARKHIELAERFVQVMSTLRQTRAELARRQSLEGLAQMAAGAAHELNNPLAVISGRAQLLLTAEEDADKKKILGQIQERTEEMSQIVTDLMAFARPTNPQKRAVSLDELLHKAVEKTRTDAGLTSLEINFSGLGQPCGVYVDVHQVTQSLSSILTNALQSYKGDNGPVWIDCADRPDEKRAVVMIRDAGCGMDAETLEKATQPFFSFRPAGRRRGMGLAHAQRLLSFNGGNLKLASEPGKGTTVTVTLPKV
jgi:putative nucleotidyltransferase with HDIG domain